MLKEIDAVKLIFGLKVQQLRREHDLSYQQLSDRTGLAISYLHNIEKGKKYPKADKILALAKALEVEYNYLVSLNGDKKLKPIIDLINSDFLQVFPLEKFGIDTAKLMELLAHTPDKVNAFLSTVINIIRNYRFQGEDFYRAALRSYQDLHDNYFEEVEAAAQAFRETYCPGLYGRLFARQLERLLLRHFEIRVDRGRLEELAELHRVRSYYAPARRTLYVNKALTPAQENFLLAKELGFQYLQLTERPLETRMLEVGNFDRLLNNFKGSYFAGALLMPEQAMIADIEQMSGWRSWDGAAFLTLLDKYAVTPEMLLQRLANLLPRRFGVRDIFFLRFLAGNDSPHFFITKEMHLSRLHDPHASQLKEHYCRRWISIDLIRRLRASGSVANGNALIADAQVSRYWNTPNAYLCFCIAQPEEMNPENTVSVTLGLLVNERLERLFPFLADPGLMTKEVSITCERCGVTDCEVRACPPVELERQRERAQIKVGLKKLD